MSNAVGINTYLALKKQSVATTVVKPDVYIPVYNAEFNEGYTNQLLELAQGTPDVNYAAVTGKNEAPKGTISMPAQAKTLGYFLAMIYGAPTTTGPSDTSAYTHTFTPKNPSQVQNYVLDKGYPDLGYVHRYWGTHADSMKFSENDATIDAEVGTVSLGVFISTQVTTTASSGTTLLVKSTKGITDSDTIVVSKGDAVNEFEYSVTVVSETQLTLGAAITGVTHTAGDRVVIKTSTPSYAEGSTFTWPGASAFSIGTAIGSVAAYDAEDFTFEVARENKAVYAMTGTAESDRFPTALLPKGIAASTTFNWYHSDPKWINYLRERQKLATQVVLTGIGLAGAATVYDSLTIKQPNLRFDPPTHKIGGNDIIMEEFAGTCVVDSSAGYSSQVVLVNGQSSI